MADKLPAWQARLLYRVGRLELVKTTLASMPIHAMMAMDLPVKTIEAANKICRGILWKGRRDVHGGHCLVAWDKVCSPKEFGGLGVPNLRLLNISLRARWPWLARTDPARSWAEFNIQVSSDSLAIYRAATKCTIGDGSTILFWTDWWLQEGRIHDILPNLFRVVKKSATKVRTVRQAKSGQWWRDVSPNMNTHALQEFIQLVDRLRNIQLADGIDGKVVWCWEGDGLFSALSAYRAHFAAHIKSAGATELWKSRALATWKFFSWLAAQQRCWTADRL